MKTRSTAITTLLLVLAAPACGGGSGGGGGGTDGDTEGGDAGSDSGPATGDTGEPGEILDYGDAEWQRPPFAPPGGEGEKMEGDEGGEDGGGGGTGGADDGGWGSSGFDDDGGSSSGDDDGGSSSSGTGDDGGSSDSTGASEGGSGETGAEAQRDPSLADAPSVQAAECPAEHEPAIFYMSNDDSNSQASPILARQTVMQHEVVDPFRIRIHEFLNYYDLSYENPATAGAEVGLQMRRIDAATGEFVLLAYAQGRQLDPADRRPVNLVFSLDTSGSMSGEPLERLKDTMTSIAGSLREGDVVSVVTWNTGTNTLLESHDVTGPADPTLMAIIAGLASDGGTDLHAGLVTAYQLAEDNYADDRINRVVMISDGGANAGVTDIDLIAAAAGDSDRDGIYLVGVGVGDSSYYRDDLMDAVTDAGKGAYVFIDGREEADRMFGQHFLQNMTVAARDVRMELTMPWYFAITEFHGEEYSKDPAEIEPQHLSFNDAMSYHQIIAACDPQQIYTTDPVRARVTYQDPISREDRTDELELAIGDIVRNDASQLYKGDVVVAYAQAFIVIGDLVTAGDQDRARQTAQDMVGWLQAAEDALGDPEIGQMRAIMAEYAAFL